jgi:predicted SprT family Zn-dependent metalloprotease
MALFLFNAIIVLFSLVFVNIDTKYNGRPTSHYSQNLGANEDISTTTLQFDGFLENKSNDIFSFSKNIGSGGDNVIEELVLTGQFKEDFLETKYSMCNNPYLHLCSRSPVDIQKIIENKNRESLREIVEDLKSKSLFGKSCQKFNENQSYSSRITNFFANDNTLNTLLLINNTFEVLSNLILKNKENHNNLPKFNQVVFELLGKLSRIGVREPFHINKKVTGDYFFEESPRNPRNIEHLSTIFTILKQLNTSSTFLSENGKETLNSTKSLLLEKLIQIDLEEAKSNYIHLDNLIHEKNSNSNNQLPNHIRLSKRTNITKYDGYKGYSEEEIFKIYGFSLNTYMESQLNENLVFYVDPTLLVKLSNTLSKIYESPLFLLEKFKHYLVLVTLKSLMSQMRILADTKEGMCSNQILHFFSLEVCNLFRNRYSERHPVDINEKITKYVSKLFKDFTYQMINQNFLNLENQKDLNALKEYLDNVFLSTNQCLLYKDTSFEENSILNTLLNPINNNNNNNNNNTLIDPKNFISLNYEILSDSKFQSRLYPFFDDFGQDSIENYVTWNSLTYTTEEVQVVAITPGLLHYTFNELKLEECEMKAILDPIIYHEFSHLVYYYFDVLYKSKESNYKSLLSKIKKAFKNEKHSENFADVLGFHFAYTNYKNGGSNVTSPKNRTISDRKCYFISHFKLFCQSNLKYGNMEDLHSNSANRAMNAILLDKKEYNEIFNCSTIIQ